MKYLKIEDNKGYYWNGTEHQPVDKINKGDILYLLKVAEKDDFEMDSYDESSLGNRAHQIIYENISNKLEEFLGDIDQFKREVDELYDEAIRKYSVEIKGEHIDEEDLAGDSETAVEADEIPF